MTLLLLNFDDRRAALAMDTLEWTPDGAGVRFATKFAVQPHLGLATACRGSSAVANGWRDRIAAALDIASIEDAAAAAPDMLREALEEFDELHTMYRADSGVLAAALECVLVGWSERASKMLAWSFHRDPAQQPGIIVHSHQCRPCTYVLPQLSSAPLPARIAIPAGFVQFAKLACQALEQDCWVSGAPALLPGGDLQLLTIERGGKMTVERIHRFADYRERAKQVRAPDNPGWCAA